MGAKRNSISNHDANHSPDLNPLLDRVRTLEQEGFDSGESWGRALLEHRIDQWPTGWGEDLHILIYGDFKRPETELYVEPLGIKVLPEKLEKTIVQSAMCVLKAIVEVEGKTVDALIDAARRINILLGTWNLVTWGNSAIGWWSLVTHSGGGGVLEPLNHEDLDRALNAALQLQSPLRQKVDAALYWIRKSRNSVSEFYRSDLLNTYASYWNAFECLVEGVCMIRPQLKLSRSEKQARLDEFIAKRSGKLTPGDIQECYNEIVNPAFKGKASHALRECFGDSAQGYINECFESSTPRGSLYDIRNSINHGEVDAENPEELIRIEARLNKLWIILWGMFGRLLPFPAPLDTDLHVSA